MLHGVPLSIYDRGNVNTFPQSPLAIPVCICVLQCVCCSLCVLQYACVAVCMLQ